MLQYLAAKKDKIVCLHFLLFSDQGILKDREESKVIGRLSAVGSDFFIIVTYKNGKKDTRIYPYPTPGLQSISIDLDEIEDSDILIQFQKEEYEYQYLKNQENIKSKHPEM